MLRHYSHIKTLPFPTFRWHWEALRVEWRNSLTVRFELLPEREIKILNISFPVMEIEPATYHVYILICSVLCTVFLIYQI